MTRRDELLRAIAYYEHLAEQVDSGRRAPSVEPQPVDLIPVIRMVSTEQRRSPQ